MHSCLDEAHGVTRMSSFLSQSSSNSRRTGQVMHEGRGKCENLIITDAELGKSVGVSVDVDEPSPKRFKCSPQSRKSQKFTFQGINRIEDNDDDNDITFRNGNEDGDVNVKATSSKKSHPPVNQSNNFDELGDLHCPMHPCNGPSRNHFGLYTDSECSSSESDGSDCLCNEDAIAQGEKDTEEAALRKKVLEDIHNSSCEIFEQWEEAVLRKKVLEDIQNCQSGLDDHGSTSGLDIDHVREEVSLRKKVLKDILNCHCVLDNHGRAFRLDADCVNLSNEYAWNKLDAPKIIDSTYCCMSKHSPGNDTVQSSSGNPRSEEKSNVIFSPSSKYERVDPSAGCYATVDHVIKKSTGHSNIGDVDLEKHFLHRTQCEIQVNDDNMILQCSEEAIYGEPSLCHSQLLVKTMPNNGGSFQLKEEEGLEESSLCSIGPQNERAMCCPINCSRNMGDIPSVQNNLIIGREKHKETDEYKHALELEWESRQQQLEIQAKEAQLLRKRKKAEKLRLLDTERRQKQRVEEMRESLKKDEETMTLKEKLRANFRRKLDKLELQYQDMASLLRGLGIHVRGGCHPESCQVNSAYRQALLRFHPDRVSKSDIHQQVEAEEIFKLLSRLKEKHFPKA